MSKVVTERPRYGHANRSAKTALRIHRYDPEKEYDEYPKRISSSRRRQHGWDGKDFSDRLGPLRRFLRSRVGKPWDKVYSELSRNLDRRSLTGIHIWIHVDQEVEQDCVIGPDGRIYRNPPRSFDELREARGLYVHPLTGILCYREWSWRNYWREREKTRETQRQATPAAHGAAAPAGGNVPAR